MMVVVPLIAGTNYFGFRWMGKVARKAVAAYSEANGIALQCIGHIRTVVAYTMEPLAVDKYKAALRWPMKKGIDEVGPRR